MERRGLGSALVLQVGDCVEKLAECGSEHTAAKLAVLDWLAGHLTERAARPTVQVARIAGQLAKPRSQLTERIGVRELPAFRGHMINSEQPTVDARRHDPRRMLRAYEASDKILSQLRSYRAARQLETTGPVRPRIQLGPWASHEALVLDYEGAQLRVDPPSGLRYLASTHFPWIGDRTRQVDGAHVHLLAPTGNPIGCKIGPGAEPAEVARLCEILNPGREPGRLSLIVRFGRNHITEMFPPIVERIAVAGHPVIWMTDPMHGNTVRSRAGIKTRRVDDLVTEVREFRRILGRYDYEPAGLHLEVAADDVSPPRTRLAWSTTKFASTTPGIGTSPLDARRCAPCRYSPNRASPRPKRGASPEHETTVSFVLQKTGFSGSPGGAITKSGVLMCALRVAIVGCGAAARDCYLSALPRFSSMGLTALVDPDPRHAEAAREWYSQSGGTTDEVRIATDLAEVLPDFDAAIVTAPHTTHFRLARELLTNAKHVLLEKPMTTSLSDAEQLLRVVQKNDNVLLAMAHPRRLFPANTWVRELIRHGTLGKVRRVEWKEGHPYRWEPVSWSMFDRELAGGGVIIDTASHVFDVLLWWFGPQAEVLDYMDDSLGGVEADALVTLRIGDVDVSLEVSRLRPLGASCVVTGTESEVRIGTRFVAGECLLISASGEELYRGQAPWVQSAQGRWEVDQLANFAAACARSGVEPYATGEDGRRVVELIERCYQPARRRTWPQPWLTRTIEGGVR